MMGKQTKSIWVLLVAILAGVLAEDDPLQPRANVVAVFDTFTYASDAAEDGIAEQEAQRARLCTDDPNLQHKTINRNTGQFEFEGCDYVSEQPMRRCNWEFVNRDGDSDGTLLKDYCPLSCGRCPGRTQVIPCPDELDRQSPPDPLISTEPPSSTSSSETTSSTSSSMSSSTLDTVSQAAKRNEKKLSTALAISLSMLFLLLVLLLWIYWFCCRASRDSQKYGDDESTDNDDDEENANVHSIHNVKSTESMGSRLIGFVGKVFNGRKNDPQIDVRRCTSAVCEACEDDAYDKLNRVMSVDSYEKRKKGEEFEC